MDNADSVPTTWSAPGYASTATKTRGATVTPASPPILASSKAPAHHPRLSTSPIAINGKREGEKLELPDVGVDDAGNVYEERVRQGPEPGSQRTVKPVAANQVGQETTLTASAEKPQASLQPQLDLEASKTIGRGRVTPAELRTALYQFIPRTGKIAREELFEKVSLCMGLPLEKTRSELYRVIGDEWHAGRLELDAGYRHVWRP